MFRFIIIFLFSVIQVLLTEQLFYALKRHSTPKIIIFFAAKFLLYGIGVRFAVLKNFWDLDVFIYSFIAAMPIAVAVVYLVKYAYPKEILAFLKRVVKALKERVE